MFKALTAVGLATGLATAASGEPAPEPATPAPQQKIVVTGKAKKVCESITKTGSILPTRICKTEEEWEEIRAANMRTLERFRTNQDVATAIQARKEAEAGR